MRNVGKRTVLAAAVALLVAGTATSCAPLSALDEIMLPTGGMNMLSGELRSVDARRGRIQVREDHGNRRTHTLRYDNRTRVIYQGRQQSASHLQRGDIVRVRVSRDRSGTQWADQVEVRNSGRDGRDGRTVSSRVERLDGVVRQVDTRRGYFMVEESRSRTIVVRVPARLSSGDARRFERLRRGERVRVEVRALGRNEVQLVRFR
jgi:hypothetical protein